MLETDSRVGEQTPNDLSRTVRSWKFEPVLGSRHFQTIAGVIAPHFTERSFRSERKIIRVAKEAQIAVDFSLQKNPEQHPTVLVIHGMNGSSNSPFSIGIAHKSIHYGFNVARVNLRSAGDTENLSQTLYHSGQSEDVFSVLELIKEMGLTEKTYIAAISLSGNMSLKAVGELGEKAKESIGGLVVVSSVVDTTYNNGHHPVDTSIYRVSVVNKLKKAVRKKAERDGKNWDTSRLSKIHTVYEFDDAYQAGPKPIRWGFVNADDYHNKANAFPFVSKIAIPTLAIHAEDDPIISVEPLRKDEISKNTNIFTLITKHGGHGGFILAKTPKGDLDRHWAENRVIEFFRLLNARRH